MGLSSPDDWTLFLQNSTPTSFGPIFPDNYQGAIREFWQRHLTGNLEHAVDVGCGNGALCWIADELLNRPRVSSRITGVDFADIDPFRVLGRDRNDYPGVEFIGNTFAEHLPFADRSVDLIVSQYGIEYTDLNRSIAEVARVLKPAGRMVFVLHDTNSEVVKLSIAPLDDMRTVLSLGIHDLVLQFHELGLELRTVEERQRSAEFRALGAGTRARPSSRLASSCALTSARSNTCGRQR
jgi:SAM-dependent methyltransferase